MRTVFADAGYWIALLNRKDELHKKAKAVSASLGQVRIVTSEMVLTEVLNFFSDRGPELREVAVSSAQRLRSDPNVTVVQQTSLQFQSAIKLYSERGDKAWSLSDCASILIMREQGIQEALTHDRHFAQAGFTPLLRDDTYS